jgi:hypothetical protein
VRIGQCGGRRLIGRMRQPRHIHIDLIDEQLLGISGAYAAFCEFRYVVSDEAEAGACSGGKPARATRLPAVSDALEPRLQVAHKSHNITVP